MSIKIETGENGRRRILVRGFYNNIKDNILESACCIDCAGNDRIEKLELRRGDVVVADQELNRILISNGTFTLSMTTSFEIVGEKPRN